MANTNQPNTQNTHCLNCNYTFSGDEVYCPNCGQKNKGRKIAFKSFIREIFAGFFSWDAKFWRTLFPLLFKPGKISKDYIEGKRVRYTNPFRFYITSSILFFLALGINSKLNTLKDLSKKQNNVASSFNLEDQEKKIDSIQTLIKNELNNTPKDSLQTQSIDSSKVKQPNISFLGDKNKLDTFLKFNKNNPKMNIDEALDSLNYEKSYWNRFLYDRAELANSFFKKKEQRMLFANKMLSYGSVSTFILLPVFAFFLMLLYMRKRKYTYVEHLIFVFHTQTVFFLFLTIVLIINIIFGTIHIGIFLIVFLLYLFIAMKRFYKQGYFKTILKFLLINLIYFFIAIIGGVFVMLVSFMLF